MSSLSRSVNWRLFGLSQGGFWVKAENELVVKRWEAILFWSELVLLDPDFSSKERKTLPIYLFLFQ